MVVGHRSGTADAHGVDRSVRVTIPLSLAEVAGAVLMEALGPFQEEPWGQEGRMTLVFYPPAGGTWTAANLVRLLPEAFASPGVVQVESRDVAREWVEGWREHFRPTVIGTIRIRPPWESPAPGPVTSNEEPASGQTAPPAAEQSLCPIDVVINPGLGFGTGLHPTTRGTLLLLQQGAELAPPGVAGRGALVDVGTGSGILAIAAARLGWAPVIALDNDPVAVASARENVALNLVEPQVEVHGVDVAHARRAWFRGATVLANMTLEPVSLLLRRLSAEGVLPRRLVVSGILAGSQEERLLRVADECGHSPGRRLYDEEWVSLELVPGQAES